MRVVFLAGVLQLALTTVLPIWANSPIPDSALDDDILYRRGHATLLAAPAKQLAFFLTVDNSGTGYLVEYGNPKGLAPNGVPEYWGFKKDSLTLDKLDKEWTKLSRTEALKVWGDPHHVPGRPGLSIFDAHGNYNGEENIYHLDLIFDKNDMLYRYRIRGIGICHAKWITLASDGSQIVSE